MGGYFSGQKMEIPGKWGGLREIPSVMGVWIFSGTTHFHYLLVSKLSANFMIFSLFLWISEICCLLTPYSADKLVPFSPLFNRKIIDCLISFVKRTDRLHFKNVMIVMMI